MKSLPYSYGRTLHGLKRRPPHWQSVVFIRNNHVSSALHLKRGNCILLRICLPKVIQDMLMRLTGL